MSPDELRAKLSCWERWGKGCEAEPQWVVQWRKDFYDPFMRGQDGYMDNNACDRHLAGLLEWLSNSWDGHAHVMSVEFYVQLWAQGKQEAFHGQGLGSRY